MRHITRAQANELLKARALELYHAARAQREERIRVFEAEYGRADRIDQSVLADPQRTQARLAAIAACQQRSSGTGAEPRIAKFVDQIGTMIGSISAHLATERALELLERLFVRCDQHNQPRNGSFDRPVLVVPYCSQRRPTARAWALRMEHPGQRGILCASSGR